ncbi:MAG: PhaM family polyhydroxyalkanoate granule multifunctional regulatory protein [Usitatibacter sp.]
MAKPVTPHDMYDLWQKMVNPGAYPLQGMMFPIPDSKDIEKKLGELAVVEHWLKANVNMVQLTQKTLQYQLAMLKGGEKAQDMMAHMGREEEKPADPPNPAAWAWNMMAEGFKPPKPVRKRRGKT